MPAVSHCPRCHVLVSLPSGVDPSARVRCPRCDEEFPLREAIDNGPPELIVVETGPSPAPSPQPATPGDAITPSDRVTPDGWATSDDRAAPGDDNDQETGAVEDSRSSDGPLPIASIAWDDAAGVEASRLEPAADVAPAGETVPGSGDPFDAQLDATPEASLSAAMADPPFALAGALPAEPLGSSDGPSLAVSARRGPSAFRTMVGIIGGGVCGLAIGYLVLLWIGGPPKDFLHVGSDLPAFLVPRSFHVALASHDAIPRTAARSATHHATETLLPTVRPAADPLPVDGRSRPPAASPHSDGGADPGTRTSARPTPSSRGIEAVADRALSRAGTARPATAEIAPPILGGPTYGPDDLAVALARARKAEPALVTGSLADRATRRAKANAYRIFSRLAEVTTFARSHDSGTEIEPYRRAVANLVLDCVKTGSTFEQLARIGDQWLKARNRSGRGAWLAGEIDAIEPQGDFFAVRLRSVGRRAQGVLCRERPDVQVGDQVTVLGAIETEPATHITGYAGPQETIVWAGQIVRVP